MRGGWLAVLGVLGVLVLVVLCLGIALVARRRAISRPGATFELSHRMRDSQAGRGWVLGLGRYTGESLEWFRIFSLSPRPKRVFSRAEVTYEGVREAGPTEAEALYADHVVVSCRTPSGPVELAMSRSSVMGFQAWVESGPPGTNWDSKPLR